MSLVNSSEVEIRNYETAQVTKHTIPDIWLKGAAASLLQDGQIMISGGYNQLSLGDVHSYSLSTGAVTKLADMNHVRYGHHTTSLHGVVFVVGSSGRFENSIESYN